jgi:hypothetical protein
MADITSYLPAWLVAAAVPAGAVMGFFWKGDEAIGPDMKDWLSKTIAGQNPTRAQVSTIDPLRRIFDAVYGRKPNGLPSFIRVALISTLAFFAVAFFFGLIVTSLVFRFVPAIPQTIGVILINALFDYASVTKALFIMERIRRGSAKTALFLLLDFFGTLLILLVYGLVFVSYDMLFGRADAYFGSLGELLLGLAFFATTFLTFVLTLLYVFAVRVLRFAHSGEGAVVGGLSGSKLRSGISWALPVKTLPVRSIGIMAGFLLFLALLIVAPFRGA